MSEETALALRDHAEAVHALAKAVAEMAKAVDRERESRESHQETAKQSQDHMLSDFMGIFESMMCQAFPHLYPKAPGCVVPLHAIKGDQRDGGPIPTGSETGCADDGTRLFSAIAVEQEQNKKGNDTDDDGNS